MSMMRRAVLEGSRVIGFVVVEIVSREWIGGEVGVGGWVRSKPVDGW
jgi:hypothetical protein